MSKQRSVHDWTWNGAILGVPVMRHGFVNLRLFGGRVVVKTAESPRWFVRVPGLSASWWPNDPARLSLRVFGRCVR